MTNTNLKHNKINLSVLISGSGRTLKNIIDKIEDGYLNAAIKLVISSNPKATGLQWAEKYGIQTSIINRADFKNTDEFSHAITGQVDKFSIDLILLAGFIHFYRIPDKYFGKVMNIHPGLIPAFCGKGYYGRQVHKAVIDYGAKVSGCTVHFADNKYDNGPIILQRTVQIKDDDTPETLGERVFQEECISYPEAIKLFAEGKLEISGRRVKIGS
mgnify:CR=1 FL=1